MGKVILSGVSKGMKVPEGPSPISEFAVGSTVNMNVNGSAKEFIIVHQGNPSSLYDSSCNGAWLLMKDIYERRQWNSSNVNDYKNSTIHTYLNGTFLNLFDANIQSTIKQVKIPYINGTGGSSVSSGTNGLSTKIFLLSAYEVGFTTSDISNLAKDGARLEYFPSGASDSSANTKRKATGAYTTWLLRSAYTTNTTSCFLVTASGTHGGQGCAPNESNQSGIRPALILPSTTLVSKRGNVLGAV